MTTPTLTHAERAKHRRVLARRLNWPAGALATCETIETENPRWFIRWERPIVGPEGAQAGFYGTIRAEAEWRPRPGPFGRTADELRSSIRGCEAAIRLQAHRLPDFDCWYLSPGLVTYWFKGKPGFYGRPRGSDMKPLHAETANDLFLASLVPQTPRRA